MSCLKSVWIAIAVLIASVSVAAGPASSDPRVKPGERFTLLFEGSWRNLARLVDSHGGVHPHRLHHETAVPAVGVVFPGAWGHTRSVGR